MMTFELTQDQLMIQELVRNFTSTDLAPIAAELDLTARFPAEIFASLTEMGMMGINIPAAYGGAELDGICKILAIEELAKGCASTAEIFVVHTTVSEVILRHGNEAQKEKYLTAAASGKLGAFALTEPGAGSDAGAVKTRADSDGDDYIINGTKCFISNMGPHEGDYIIVMALTQPEKGLKGMSAIIVDRATPGFSLGKTEDKMGLRAASVSEVIFQDCRVPKSNLLGNEGDGFKIAMAGLDSGRIGMATQALGLSEAAIEASITYMKARVQFGKPIAVLQGLQWYIADMATRTEAARGLIFAACDAVARGLPATKLAAQAKYYASENAVWVTNKALQIHGGYGYMRDYPIERMYRDARIIPIYDGTSEIQRGIIAREVMK